MILHVIIDVDGTLTDGIVYISNNGELCKGFYVRDGLGIQRIIHEGVIPVILTSRKSDIVIQRALELGITEIYQGIKDKKVFLEKYIQRNNIYYDQLAYIADDINDYDAIQLAGLRGCPVDADESIKAICNFVSKKRGGYGAVREFCDLICRLNKSNKKDIDQIL